MAITMSAAEAAVVAEAAMTDLGDANHPLWQMGAPGIGTSANVRFDQPDRATVVARMALVIKAAVDAIL